MTMTDEIRIPSGEFITTFNAPGPQHLLALKKKTGSYRNDKNETQTETSLHCYDALDRHRSPSSPGLLQSLVSTRRSSRFPWATSSLKSQRRINHQHRIKSTELFRLQIQTNKAQPTCPPVKRSKANPVSQHQLSHHYTHLPFTRPERPQTGWKPQRTSWTSTPGQTSSKASIISSWLWTSRKSSTHMNPSSTCRIVMESW